MRTSKLDHLPLFVFFALVALISSLANAEESDSAKAFAVHWEAAEKAFEAQDYQAAVNLYAKVAEIVPFEPTVRFRLACCWARLGEKDKAFASLSNAIDRGWADADALQKIRASQAASSR